MAVHLPQSIIQFLQTYGSNGLVDMLIGSLITLTIVFFKKIGSFFSSIITWIWAIFSRRGKDHKFTKAYLKWIISENRYLGLLPARIVTTRWGEEQRFVDLEKIYVTLSVSDKANHQDKSNFYNKSSWYRRPWWHHVNLNPIFYTAIPFLGFYVIATAIFPSSILSLKNPIFIIIIFILLIFLLSFTIFFSIKRGFASKKDFFYQPGNIAQSIDKHQYLIIQGNPGSGKTTLLHYLTITCARALQGNKKLRIESNNTQKQIHWYKHPFPMLVTLRRFHDVAHWDEKKQLIDTFMSEMPPELKKQCPKNFFERKLTQGNCLILLDAFDELGSPESRTAMAHRINNFIAVYDNPHNRIVVTTRITGYEGQLDRYGFQIQTAQPLDAGSIRALIKQRYSAIALTETERLSTIDAAPILRSIQRRSEQLIKKIENTSRLAQLATNPLLLSLIVLVHHVKLELPEERVLLYRDCVEILTEQWQRTKRANDDKPLPSQEDLSLSQKLALLQKIALSMQKQRDKEDQQTLLPQAQVQVLVADALADIIGNQLPTSLPERHEICNRRAEEWIRGIQVESGILVTQGLDEEGQPVIGFSHLTFQEYLAATAINEYPGNLALLINNLLTPAWREVVLLSVAMASDATPVVEHLLHALTQPAGVILAGSCLAEKVKHVKSEIQQEVLTKLQSYFEQEDEENVIIIGNTLAAMRSNEVTIFMRQQITSTTQSRRLEAIKALGQLKAGDPHLEDVQKDLVNLLDTSNDVAIVMATTETLAQIGDPRFANDAPITVSIPQQLCSLFYSPKSWQELHTSPAWRSLNKWKDKLLLLSRTFDYYLFMKIHPLRKKHPTQCAFEIGKYLVTNTEYARFIEATGHHTPNFWLEGAFPVEKATHPVTGITEKDVRAYCKWLSQTTGEHYRLPTEWEWEWAATTPLGNKYPWGNHFNKDICNTGENSIGETTPVGSYPTGASYYYAMDICGNAYEITQGYINSAEMLITLILAFIFFILSLPLFSSLLPSFSLSSFQSSQPPLLSQSLIFLLLSLIFLFSSLPLLFTSLSSQLSLSPFF